MAFSLPTDFDELFRHEPYQEPALTGRGAFNRAILLVGASLLGGLLLPALPTRPFFRPHASEAGPAKVVFSLVMAGLAGAFLIYRYAWRPWRDGPPGYRLVGEFEVREKDYLFSRRWVRLVPGSNFLVQVPPELYEQLRVGSRLRLIYTAEGEQVSVTRLP